jgi:hypothetical protein
MITTANLEHTQILTISVPFNVPCFFQTDVIANFHVGEVISSLQKATLIPGGSESLVYTTLSGGIGMLVPFTSHEVMLEYDKFYQKE